LPSRVKSDSHLCGALNLIRRVPSIRTGLQLVHHPEKRGKETVTSGHFSGPSYGRADKLCLPESISSLRRRSKVEKEIKDQTDFYGFIKKNWPSPKRRKVAGQGEDCLRRRGRKVGGGKNMSRNCHAAKAGGKGGVNQIARGKKKLRCTPKVPGGKNIQIDQGFPLRRYK